MSERLALKKNCRLDSDSVRAYSYVVRYSAEHKARSHEKILSMAARSFRERGGDSSGIGTVMRKVGLKKGGFYRHFKSKDDLFVEAVARALDETGRGMEEVAKSAPEGQAVRAIIERYLSVVHANSPGSGCVRAALGPELARKPLSVRKRIETLLEAYRERLSPFFPGQTQEERLAKCRLLFPSMAGVLMMVRVSPDFSAFTIRLKRRSGWNAPRPPLTSPKAGYGFGISLCRSMPMMRSSTIRRVYQLWAYKA